MGTAVTDTVWLELGAGSGVVVGRRVRVGVELAVAATVWLALGVGVAVVLARRVRVGAGLGTPRYVAARCWAGGAM